MACFMHGLIAAMQNAELTSLVASLRVHWSMRNAIRGRATLMNNMLISEWVWCLAFCLQRKQEHKSTIHQHGPNWCYELTQKVTGFGIRKRLQQLGQLYRRFWVSCYMLYASAYHYSLLFECRYAIQLMHTWDDQKAIHLGWLRLYKLGNDSISIKLIELAKCCWPTSLISVCCLCSEILLLSSSMQINFSPVIVFLRHSPRALLAVCLSALQVSFYSIQNMLFEVPP